MAEADIAYVATAGAAGLALAISAWAWRLRARLNTREHEVETWLADARRQAAACEGALNVFDDVRLALTPEGAAQVAFGAPEALAALAPGRAGDAAASAIVQALNETHTARMEGLVQRGEAFETLLESADGAWAVEGRALGGSAWLRLSKLGGAETAADAGLGALAEASPAPTWVVDGAGQLIWANRAWLTETRAETLAEARETGLSFDRGADAVVAEASRLNARQEGFRWVSSDGRRKAWRILAEPLAGGRGAVIAFAIDPAWLDERPTHAELLDRLRQKRQLPEVVDYAGWKARELDFYGAAEASPDDSWSLPDGRTLRVVRQPHPLGGILLIFSDITDELQLRSRYNAQIQVQTATLDKLNDAVAVFGSDGRLRLNNDAFEAFWGVSAEALAEAGDFDAVAALCRPVLDDAALWLGLKARVADPDPESRVPISGEGRTDDDRVVAWQTRPLPDGATLVAFSDVTARRELEQALAAKEAALAESQALKREFVGSVSYELRTPLTTIVGYSELLEAMGDLPERSRQHAGAIRVAASHLARSIDDVLDMAQIDAGEMELTLGDMRVCDLLEEAAGKVRAKVEGRGAVLSLACPAGLKPLRADARRIAQAVDHLLENACRAVSEGGTVTLTAEAGPGEVRIRVEDTGRGIPYHLQAHVFDRFVRRERGGPGVALALVKALVELHGGWAEVQSEPGKGAAFILHLPVEATAPTAAPELLLG